MTLSLGQLGQTKQGGHKTNEKYRIVAQILVEVESICKASIPM